MQVVIWILTVAALAAMYWGFRVNQNLALRMLVFAGVGAVYVLGILQGMDEIWFNGTTVAILIVALWPAKKTAPAPEVPLQDAHDQELPDDQDRPS